MRTLTACLVITMSVVLFITGSAWGGQVTIPNSFSAGTPAVAAEVNDNFKAVEQAVDDNNARINTNSTNISTNATNIQSKQNRVTGTCSSGYSIRTINSNGTVVCERDDVGIGDITGVFPGTGLSGGSTSGDATLSANTNYLQRRVSGYCPTGQSIRSISSTGTVVCEVDDSGGDGHSLDAADGSPANVIFVDNSGAVGIGTMAPNDNLDIRGEVKFSEEDTTSTSSYVTIRQSTWYRSFLVQNSDTNTSYFSVASDGIGMGVAAPSYPLHMASGAHVTSGGAWVNASSREYKENIRDLSTEDALAALHELRPTRFNYKIDNEEECLGFIAEDVPELLATKDRKGISPIDIITVLTKVVQRQQEEIEALKSRLDDMQ